MKWKSVVATTYSLSPFHHRPAPQVAEAVNAAAMEAVLGPGDFFSLAALALLEPLLMLRGYGRYGVCGAPLAGCAAVIVHTEVGL
jgi:hypothetical protein